MIIHYPQVLILLYTAVKKICKLGYMELQRSCSFINSSVHYLQGAALVESLKICSSSLTDKALFNLLDHLQNLQELELSSCNEVTEDGLNAALPKKLRRLVISPFLLSSTRVLRLIYYNNRCCSVKVQLLCYGCTQVISDCIHVADVTVSYIASNLICLNSFEIQV